MLYKKHKISCREHAGRERGRSTAGACPEERAGRLPGQEGTECGRSAAGACPECAMAEACRDASGQRAGTCWLERVPRVRRDVKMLFPGEGFVQGCIRKWIASIH